MSEEPGQTSGTDLGETLSQYRIASAISLRGMAHLIRCDHSMLSRVERGIERPTRRIVVGYEDALSLPAGTLSGLLPRDDGRSRPGAKSTTQSVSKRSKANLGTIELSESTLHFDAFGRPTRYALRYRVRAQRAGLFCLPVFTFGARKLEDFELQHVEGGKAIVLDYDTWHSPLGIEFRSPLEVGETHECGIVMSPRNVVGVHGFGVSTYENMKVETTRFRLFFECPDEEVGLIVHDRVLPHVAASGGLSDGAVDPVYPQLGFRSITFDRLEFGYVYGVRLLLTSTTER